ncbi:MAG: sugar transferase [Pseudomonadota bacterium]
MTDHSIMELEPRPALRSADGPRRGPGLRNLAKRAFDVCVAATLLIILAPTMALIAIVIRRQSDGPVLFGHERVGLNGESFKCLKFRTMRVDAAEALADLLATDAEARAEWESCRKLKEDPRVLGRLGHFLRCSSLDELPQLLNVLRGDMSLVGPRPVTEEELDRYGASRRHYLSVRPGVTGPWQVGDRNDCSFDERVSQDRNYVMHGGLGTDVSILLRTLAIPFRGSGY